MFSVNLIERHFESHRFEQILLGVVQNGLQLPLPLRIRLAQSPIAAVALGLRRLVDLTYTPTQLSQQMAAFTISCQEPDGSFGYDPLPTACVIAALGKVLTEHHSEDPAIIGAYNNALEALATMQAFDPFEPLFICADDRTTDDRALTGAFILLLLTSNADFRQTVRSAPLLDWFEQNQDMLDAPTFNLWQLAQLEFTTANELIELQQTNHDFLPYQAIRLENRYHTID